MDRSERILVVDDEPRNVRLLEGIFRTAGYSVDSACDGPEALRRIAESPPDLVLLDVMMPGLSGHEVCRSLKEDPATRPIPVVLVTSLSSTEDKVEGLDIGADDFVSKPVNRMELLAKARSLLRVKSLHDQVVEAKRQLERTHQDLVQLEQMKESLVQMIVHDLKNPLTAIMGNLNLVLSTRTDPDAARRRAGHALESSRGMMRMIMNLLDIGRMEENRLDLRPQELDVAALVRAVIRENCTLVEAAAVGVAEDLPETLPAIRADEGLVVRILGNLLSNAIRHTPEGGRITVGARMESDELRLWVADTGAGIPEEYQELIFEKFRQAETKTRGVRHDHGLGLTFCRMAAEAHGGRIWVRSVEGKGSTFLVALPLTATPEGCAVAAGSASAESGRPSPPPGRAGRQV